MSSATDEGCIFARADSDSVSVLGIIGWWSSQMRTAPYSGWKVWLNVEFCDVWSVKILRLLLFPDDKLVGLAQFSS